MGKDQCKLSRQQKEEIVQRYIKGEPVTSLIKAFGATSYVIKRTLERAGVKVRNSSEAAKMRQLIDPTGPSYLPTPEQIAIEKAEIRAENTREKRSESIRGYNRGTAGIRVCKVITSNK